MPSLFAGLGAVAGATVDAVFSEGFVLIPMAPPAAPAGGRRDVNADYVGSSTRAQIPFSGTYVAPGELMNAHGRTKADSTTHWVAGAKVLVDAAASAVPQRPQERDQVRRLDTGEVFEVVKCLDGDYGRIRIFLTDVAAKPVVAR